MPYHFRTELESLLVPSIDLARKATDLSYAAIDALRSTSRGYREMAWRNPERFLRKVKECVDAWKAHEARHHLRHSSMRWLVTALWVLFDQYGARRRLVRDPEWPCPQYRTAFIAEMIRLAHARSSIRDVRVSNGRSTAQLARRQGRQRLRHFYDLGYVRDEPDLGYSVRRHERIMAWMRYCEENNIDC